MGLMGCVFMAAILTGCFTSWVICFMRKFEVSKDCTIKQWIQIHGGDLIYELVECDFCLSWWLGWVVTVPLVVVSGHWWLLVTPFFSTTISRWLCAS